MLRVHQGEQELNMFDNRKSSIIKDLDKLSFEYVPEKLVHREPQMASLRMLFRPVLESGRSATAFLIGSVGTGKTATAKRFCLDIRRYAMDAGKPVDHHIINCRRNNSDSSVLLSLIRHYDPGYPDRGFSVAEMMKSVKKHVEKRGQHLIVVLDEVDVLIKKGASDIIYQLSRFNEESINVSSSVSLIMISQEYVLDRLDSASLSTFRRTNAISFDRYKRDELLDIVRARADEALHAGHARDDSLELMADIAAEWGDARFVIEMLERSAMIAEGAGASEVDAEHVREAKAMTYSVVTESKLTELDRQQKLTLLAVARSIKGDAYVNTGQAEKAYVLACEEYGEKARKHTQFWTYIRSLSDQGLLETSVRGDPDGGRTTYISLPDMPAKVLKEKMAQLLQDGA